MPRWSDYIRNLGTAGPATLQGIYNLGFALRSEIPALFNKYLRVDASQTFSAPERLQGRQNLGLGTMATQDATGVAITGGSIAGIADLAIADGGTGASTAPAARTNLGLGNVDNTSDANKPVSTAQQTALNLKANAANATLTGVPTAPTAAPGTNTTQIATTAFVQAAAVTSAFTQSYESAQQTITAGGLLTLPHGLSAAPKFVAPVIVCVTAEAGYSVGDVIPLPMQTATDTTTNHGASVEESGATNILVRFGSNTPTLIAPNKGNGGSSGLTSANWRLVMRAYR